MDNNTYEIVSKITSLKFKRQLDNSGIEFDRILQVKDLETNDEWYHLTIGDKGYIQFDDTLSFINEFIILLRKSLEELNNEFEELQRIAAESTFYDETQHYYEHERIGLEGSKQNKLLKLMYIFKEKLENHQ